MAQPTTPGTTAERNGTAQQQARGEQGGAATSFLVRNTGMSSQHPKNAL
jgi:hypothetical protein